MKKTPKEHDRRNFWLGRYLWQIFTLQEYELSGFMIVAWNFPCTTAIVNNIFY